MDYKDYYAALGVPKTASADEIQRAYRKLARKYHPDVNRDAGAEDRFKEISEAYEVLKDPEKRSTYDRFGTAWKAQGGTGAPPPGFENIRFDFGGEGPSGFSSFFESLFGGKRRGGGGSPFGGFGGFAGFGDDEEMGGFRPRGADQEARLVLSLEEAAAGGERELTLTDPAAGTRTYTVNLPKGVKPGQKVRLAGRGGRGGNGAPAGDLYLKVEVKPHDRFRLEDRDLHTTLPVSPWEAALGGEATIRTLEGPIKVRIPAGSSSGRRIRLREKGFPNPKGSAGDLYAEIRVMVPDQLTGEEKELFEQLAEVSRFRPR